MTIFIVFLLQLSLNPRVFGIYTSIFIEVIYKTIMSYIINLY